jgi:hypothetical protein
VNVVGTQLSGLPGSPPYDLPAAIAAGVPLIYAPGRYTVTLVSPASLGPTQNAIQFPVLLTSAASPVPIAPGAIQVTVNVSVPYSGGATLSLGSPTAPNISPAGTVNLQQVGTTSFQIPTWPGTVLVATIGGAPSAGALSISVSPVPSGLQVFAWTTTLTDGSTGGFFGAGVSVVTSTDPSINPPRFFSQVTGWLRLLDTTSVQLSNGVALPFTIPRGSGYPIPGNRSVFGCITSPGAPGAAVSLQLAA